MPKFKLSINSITCGAITDYLLEGKQDELILKIWHQGFISKVIKTEIPLGSFSPGKKVELYETVFEQDIPDLHSLGFDFYDCDVFSSDDLLGGFILTPYNQLILGSDTKYFPKYGNVNSHFILSGNGGHYTVEASFEAA